MLALLLALMIAQPAPSAEGAWAESAGDAVGVYATISNPSMYDVYVVSATSDAAASAQLMEGAKPASSITVPAYGSVDFKPGGPHVKLTGMKSPLKAGDEVTLTLETDGGVALAIAAIIK
jgi:hypothetical protein